MNHDAGANCFVENRNRFSDPKATPEKFNLYNGLSSLAVAVTDLLLKVDRMTAEIEDLKYRLHQHGQI